MSQIHQKPSSIKHRLKSWKIEHNFKRNQLYFNHVSNWKLWLKFFKFGLSLACTILLVQSILQIAYLGLSPPNIILILLWERKFFKISILKNYSLMKTLNLLARNKSYQYTICPYGYSAFLFGLIYKMLYVHCLKYT